VTLLQTFINTAHLLPLIMNAFLTHLSVGIISLVTVLTCLCIGISLIALFVHFAVMGLHMFDAVSRG